MPKKPKESPDKEMLKTFEAAGLVDYMEYLQSRRRILWTNLIAGIAKGLGLTLGMSVVLGLAAWVLTILVQLPIVGEWAQAATDYMKEYQENTNYSDEFKEMNELLKQINLNTGGQHPASPEAVGNESLAEPLAAQAEGVEAETAGSENDPGPAAQETP